MQKNELIINATLPETRIALLEDGEIQELHVERDSERGIVGNIYKGKVIRVLPGMQAAFVDIGLEKAAFLYVDDVHFPDMLTQLVMPEFVEHASERLVPATASLPVGLPTPLPEPITAVEKIYEKSEELKTEALSEEEPEPQPKAYIPQRIPRPLRSEGGRHDQKRGGRGGRHQRKGRGAGGRRPFGRYNSANNSSVSLVGGVGGQSGQAGQRGGAYGPLTTPVSPEDHAALQNEYARRMLDVEAEIEDFEPKTDEISVRELQQPSPAQGDLPTEQSVQQNKEPAPNETHAPEVDVAAWTDERIFHPLEGEAVGPIEEVIEKTEDQVGRADFPDVDETGPEAMGRLLEEEFEDEPAALAAQAEPEERSLETRARPMGRHGGKGRRERGGRHHGNRRRRESQHESRNGSAAGNGNDDDIEEMPKRRRRRDEVNIADLVREGQEILVQVAKEPIGTKGARLTCHVSLPGRYLVFMPTVDHVGVSRRIEGDGERRRLKEVISGFKPAGTGVIVRTASGKQSDRKLWADLNFLAETWNEIEAKYQKARGPALVYQDLTFVLRAVRDMFTDDVDRILVDSPREHRSIMKFIMRFMPNVQEKVFLYEGQLPIFDEFGIELELERALERKVWLKSGGYLVIDQAEALVAIDVNTGRYVGKKNLEETILKTNLEAVREIAYQLRLRNFGGIIILDLIDMEKEANRDKVYKALEEELKKDRARPTIMKISQLGLIEMTRKRTRESLVRSLCEPCNYCTGRGYVKNYKTVSFDILREIERELLGQQSEAITIQCHPAVADDLLGDKRDVIENLEHEHNKHISVRSNGAYHIEQFELVTTKEGKDSAHSSEERRKALRARIQARQAELSAQARQERHAQQRERHFGEESGAGQGPEGAEGSGTSLPAGSTPHSRGGEGRFAARRRRGRRGGRGRFRNNQRQNASGGGETADPGIQPRHPSEFSSGPSDHPEQQPVNQGAEEGLEHPSFEEGNRDEHASGGESGSSEQGEQGGSTHGLPDRSQHANPEGGPRRRRRGRRGGRFRRGGRGGGSGGGRFNAGGPTGGGERGGSFSRAPQEGENGTARGYSQAYGSLQQAPVYAAEPSRGVSGNPARSESSSDDEVGNK